MDANEMKGSKISLITNSEVRYEGVLHEVDYTASTLTVANVRSFGTEDRKSSTGAVIPASDQVYEFIVFQAAMIKDLNVVAAPGPLADPAILSTGSAKPIASDPAPAPVQPAPAPAPTSSSYYRERGGHQQAGRRYDSHEHSRYDGHEGHRQQRSYADQARAPASTWQQPRRPHPHAVPAEPQKLDFKDDFDFEKGNAQLASMVGKMQLNTPQQASASSNGATGSDSSTAASDSFYDPSKSFFDSISCDALERQNGTQAPRKSRFEEQALNTETFGVEGANYRSEHSRRGRGGRGGRGQPRGGNRGGRGGSTYYAPNQGYGNSGRGGYADHS